MAQKKNDLHPLCDCRPSDGDLSVHLSDNDENTSAISLLLAHAARDGYLPALVAHELKTWFGFETEWGLKFDKRALRVLSPFTHPFPFETHFRNSELRARFLSLQTEELLTRRPSYEPCRRRLLDDGFEWGSLPTAAERQSLEALSLLSIGFRYGNDGRFTLGRNRLERARAAFLTLLLSLRDPHDMNRLEKEAASLQRALADTDTRTFLGSLLRISAAMNEALSQDILIELAFALFGTPVRRLPADEAAGLLADLSVSMTGGDRRIVFAASIAGLKENLRFQPGEHPVMILEC